MIDLVRLNSVARQRDLVEYFNKKKLSNPTRLADLKSEQLTYPYTGFDNDFTFKATPKNAYVYGSLHKYYNSIAGRGKQNYNDFQHSDLCSTIDHLLTEFPILNDFQITRLEFGFNLNLNELEVDGTVKDVIKKSFHFYDWDVLPTDSKYKSEGFMREFKRDNYSFKIYDKSAQYKINQKIIRIEMKMTRKKEFADIGIYNLKDLKKRESIEGLWRHFKKRFDGLMIIDPVRPHKRTLWKKEFFQFINPTFWKIFDRTQKTTKARYKKDALKLFEEKKLLSLKKTLKKGLEVKYSQLLETDITNNQIGTISEYTSTGNIPNAAEKGGEYEY